MSNTPKTDALERTPFVDGNAARAAFVKHGRDLEAALRDLADEAQILVNIIRENTRDGVCVLDRDMTVGTRKAIEAARNLTP